MLAMNSARRRVANSLYCSLLNGNSTTRICWFERGRYQPTPELLLAQQANARSEGAALKGAEGEELRRIDVAVDHIGVAVAGDVVETAAQSPEISEEMEALLELKVQRKIIGEAMRSGRANQLLLIVGDVEWESRTRLEGIGDLGSVNDGQFEKRHVSPGQEAIGGVPGVGPRLLWTEQRAVDVEVENLVGAGARTGVGAHQHVAFPEVVAEAQFDGVVAVVARIFEDEVAAGAAGRVVDEAAGTAFFEEFRFQIDGGGELSLEAHAPVYETRRLEGVSVDGKRSRHGPGKHAGGRIEKIVGALPGERTGNEEHERWIVDQTDSCGKLGVARVVEDVGSCEARREERSADDFVPVEADAGFDEQTIGDQPAVLGVGGGLEVVSRGRRTSGKGGIARTG